MHLRARSEHGAAAVEFALVMPILFLLMFGIYEFGRMYNAKVSMTGAVREGARVMAIRNDPSCNAGPPAGAAATVVQAAALSPALSCGEVTITPASCVPGANVVVTAARSHTYNIPFYGTGSINVTGRAVMRCGG
jgi:Flp pilus assembly protein TadG